MLNYIAPVFRPRKVIEQHIAVFGESGSGKPTLLQLISSLSSTVTAKAQTSFVGVWD